MTAEMDFKDILFLSERSQRLEYFMMLCTRICELEETDVW